MSILKSFLGVSILFGIVDGQEISSATFAITSNNPATDGIWHVVATCNTIFHGYTYDPNESFMVARFGVPISNYQDYLAGGYINTAPNGKWVISRIGYGSGGGYLSYGLSFEYDVWLNSKAPSGDCHQFIGQRDAEDYANTAPELTDPPEDTLIASSALTLDYSAPSGAQGRCAFYFQGIRAGAREAVVFINFTVPVDYVLDYIGNTVLKEAADKTWYIVQYNDFINNAAFYIMNFKYTTTDDDVSNAYSLLYVSQADAEARAAGTITTTTTTAAATTTTTTTTMATTTQTNISAQNPRTITTNVPVNASVVTSVLTSWTYTLPQTSRTSETSGYFVESKEMRNKYVHENSLWVNSGVNPLQCARLCLADGNCVSAFHHALNSSCTGHKVVYQGGNSVSGTVYYVFTN